MKKSEFENLARGDIVRHKNSDHIMFVTDHVEGQVIITRTAGISEDLFIDWNIISKRK